MSKKELRLSVLEMEKLGISLVFPQYRDAEAEANSRRVVACLNACAGISTENLEDNLPVKELADRYNALQKHCDGFAEQAAFQRDARLGALKELAIVERQRDELLKQRDELLAACLKTLSDNGHLADGDNCTLIDIKLAIRSVKGGAV